MTDETKLAADAQRGAKAQALLDNPVLAEALAALRNTYLDAWEATTARDTDARERLWQAVQIVGKVTSQLRSYAADGRLAGNEAQQIAKLGDRRWFNAA